MKRLSALLIAVAMLWPAVPASRAADGMAPIFDNLSSISYIQDGNIRYPVIGGMLIKRPANEVIGYFSSATWNMWVYTPGDLEIGLVFPAGSCPPAPPMADGIGISPIGQSPVAYGDNLLVYEYALPENQHVFAFLFDDAGPPFELYLTRLHLMDENMVAMQNHITQNTAYLTPADDIPGGPIDLLGGIGWSADKAGLRVENYGSDRFVLHLKNYKQKDIYFHLALSPSEQNKHLFYTIQNFDRAFLGMDMIKAAYDVQAYNTAANAAPGDIVGYSTAIRLPCPENEVLTLRLMGTGSAMRYVSFIINPKGDFAFPILDEGGSNEVVDQKHRDAFIKLTGLIQRAEDGQHITFDATGLDYLPYYIAAELSAKNILLTIHYSEQGERKSIDLPGQAAIPAAANRIYYPTTQAGLSAIITG